MEKPPRTPRGDCDTDDLWMPSSGGFMTMEVISEGQKGPLGFDLLKRKKSSKKKKHKKGKKK